MDIKTLVPKINSSGYKFVLAITGGGTEAIGKLLKYGGGSATLLEAVVPYSQQALNTFIGRKPEKYASSRTARAMAMAAFQKALLLQGSGTNEASHVLGIGATCTLSKSVEREGRQHEVRIAVQSLRSTTSCSLSLLEKRSREHEERVVSRLIINMIASACDLEMELADGIGLSPQESLQIRKIQTIDAISKLLFQKDSNLSITPGCVKLNGEDCTQHSHKIIFPGSFDPCHKNHVEMARIASRMYGVPVHFEISVTNVDKPPMDYISLHDRVASIQEFYEPGLMGDIFVTNTPLFAEKADIFPCSTFIVGADTMDRIFNDKYYRPQDNIYSLFEHFKAKGINFLVFGRKGTKINIPSEVESIVTSVSTDEYNDNGTSSTLIRNTQHDQ